MNRRTRRVLAVIAVLLLLGTAAGAVRVADPWAGPETTVDTDQPPRNVVQESGRVLARTDHRLRTRVYVLPRNGSDERVLRADYRHVVDRSDRQYLLVYRAHRPRALRNRTTQFHTVPAYFLSRSEAVRIYLARLGVSGEWVFDEEHGSGDRFGPRNPPRIEGSRNRYPALTRAAFTPHFASVSPFVPHEVRWRVVNRTESTVVYGIDDPYRYYRTRPIRADDVLNGSRIRVTVDRDTGRLRSIHEHRVLSYEDEDRGPNGSIRTTERRVHYVLETRVDQYGTADVPERRGTGRWLQYLVVDLLRY